MSARPPLSWRPSATHAALRRRAALIARLRNFFAAARRAGGRDADLECRRRERSSDPSLSTRVSGLPGASYLSTSPEFPMKRLLASGLGDIYQLCKVFRDGELGRWHNPEFTMLEWYRLGFDDAALMSEVDELVRELLSPERALAPAERLTYCRIAPAACRRRRAPEHRHRARSGRRGPRHRVRCEPGSRCQARSADGIRGRAQARRERLLHLRLSRLAGLVGAPSSRARRASPRASSSIWMASRSPTASIELSDADEQRRRFLHDLAIRRERGQPEPPIDEHLLSALAAGMPDCAGVALASTAW